MPYTAEQVRSRHPFELLFLGVSTATALGGLLNDAVRPGSIQEGIGPQGTVVWYLVLLLGALTAGVGIAWPERATGLILEQIGLFASGLCTLFYAVTAIVVLGGNAGFSGSMLIGYGVAAIWRARQIRRFLRDTVAQECSSNDGE